MNMSKLPPGYRFNPKDDELINHYLWRRSLYGESPSCPRMPLVNNIFGENADHPSTVFDSFGESDREEEDTVRYFFTIPKNVSSGDKDCNRVKNRIRTAGKYGTWKLQRSDPVVVKNTCTGEEEVVGLRKLLKFMESTNNGVEWSMHEFTSNILEENINNVNNYVLCRITKKPSIIRQKRLRVSVGNTTNNDNVVQENKRQHINLVPPVNEQGLSYAEIFNQQGVPVDDNNDDVVLPQHDEQEYHVQEGGSDQMQQAGYVDNEQLGCGDDMLSIQDYLCGSDFDLAPEFAKWSGEVHNNQVVCGSDQMQQGHVDDQLGIGDKMFSIQELFGSDFDLEAELAKYGQGDNNELVCGGDLMQEDHVDDELGFGNDMISKEGSFGSDFDIEAELAKYGQGDNNEVVCGGDLMQGGHVDDELGFGNDMISTEELFGSDFHIEAELAKYGQEVILANQLELQQ